MAFPRPSLAALRARVRAQIQTNMPGAATALRRSAVGVLADAMAGLSNLELGYGDWMATNLLPDTANADYVARWGAIYDIPQEGAVAAAGTVTFSATGTSLPDIPAGTVLTRQSDGMQYATQADAPAAAGSSVTVSVECLTAGSAGNAAAGGSLSLAIAIAGVNGSVAIAAGGIDGGLDVEALESWRARILERMSETPQGGAQNDYVQWALAVSGVTRAWVLPQNRGVGTVDLTFVMDGRGTIIPLAADVAAVQAALNAKRPVTADCVVFAPIPYPINYTIAGLVLTAGATLSTVQAAIAAEIADMLTRRASPAATIRQDWIETAIALAAGVDHFILASPTSDLTVPADSIAVPGTPSYE